MVWIAIEYEPYEGGEVEGVFNSKEKAVEFAKSKFRYPDKIEEIYELDPDNQLFERATVYLKSPNIEWTHWRVEEWQLT